jgi:hypothetical protein
MTRTVYGTVHDGEWVHLDEPMELPSNARVKITIESGEPEPAEPSSFLDVVQGLKLDGPSDWSTRLHDHLYGHGDSGR